MYKTNKSEIYLLLVEFCCLSCHISHLRHLSNRGQQIMSDEECRYMCGINPATVILTQYRCSCTLCPLPGYAKHALPASSLLHLGSCLVWSTGASLALVFRACCRAASVLSPAFSSHYLDLPMVHALQGLSLSFHNSPPGSSSLLGISCYLRHSLSSHSLVAFSLMYYWTFTHSFLDSCADSPQPPFL